MSIKQREYARYLIKDQCKTLLNMNNQSIADVLGVTRPTLNNLTKNYGNFTIEHIEKLENHLMFVKAAILTTEAEK